MLLDSEPRPLNQNIPVEIPSKNTPFTPKLEPVKPAVIEAPVSGSTKPESDEAEPSKAPSTAGTVVTPAPGKAEPEKVESKKIDAPKADPQKQEVSKSEPKPVRTDDGAQAKALLEGKTVSKEQQSKSEQAKSEPPKTEPAKPSALQTGKYLIQVAAYSKEEQAQAWIKKLKAAGFQAYTEKVTTSAGVRIRVRVGPFSTQAETDKALTRIKALGGSEARLVN
jgi:DedD protein